MSGNLTAGLIAGVFYLISPCATDSLYWLAAGATGFLSGFFILLTANIYIQARRSTGRRLCIFAWFTAVLAMGSKESALSLPLLLTLLEFSESESRKGWFRRLLPFYLIAFLFVLNVALIQLSYPNDGNFSRYGLSWMIPRNLLHYFIYPLAGAMPPNIGEYTLIKLIVYPVMWILPLFLGSERAKKLTLLGFGWIGISSLPFLSWIMDFEGFLPRVCDIPSRYFNIPSMGASMVVCGFCLMLHDRFRKTISIITAVLILVFMVFTSVQWTHKKVQPIVHSAETEACLVDIALSSWNGANCLYIGAFGLSEFRIDCYNKMYFHGSLIQVDPFPLDAPAGARMLCGPAATPRLYIFDGNRWSVERSFDSCARTTEIIEDR